jgi:hypothetical protein
MLHLLAYYLQKVQAYDEIHFTALTFLNYMDNSRLRPTISAYDNKV